MSDGEATHSPASGRWVARGVDGADDGDGPVVDLEGFGPRHLVRLAVELLSDGPETPLGALAEDLRTRAFDAVPKGAFFGGVGAALRESGREARGVGEGKTPYAMWLRHFPTEEVRAAMAERYGAAGADVAERWRAFWERVYGAPVEQLALTLDYVGLGLGKASAGRLFVEEICARRLASGRGIACDALDVARFSYRSDVAKRERVAHALEDACLHLALERAGVPVGYVAFSNALPARRKGSAKDGREVALRKIVPRAKGASRFENLGRVRSANFWRDFNWTPEYWATPAFLRSTSRAFRVAEGHTHACAVLLDMARQGHDRAFVKHALQKGGTWVVDLSGVDTMRDAMAAFVRGLGEEAFDLETADGDDCVRFVVQEFRPFHFEHRFFVVRGRIVASTPSDRSLASLDAKRTRGRLDPRVAEVLAPADVAGPYDRADTRSVAARCLVAAMARRARAFLAKVADDPVSQAMLGRAFVIDVGSNDPNPAATGKVDLVEVNSFRRAGLYAVDVDALAKALADVADWAAPVTMRGAYEKAVERADVASVLFALAKTPI